MEDEQFLVEIAERIHKSQRKRSENPPVVETIKILLLHCYWAGFICPYCKIKMDLRPSFPYKNAPSLDHKTPLTHGGSSDADNLHIVCHQCNLQKSTMHHQTYIDYLKCLGLGSELQKRVFDESHKGKFAEKMVRDGSDDAY